MCVKCPILSSFDLPPLISASVDNKVIILRKVVDLDLWMTEMKTLRTCILLVLNCPAFKVMLRLHLSASP